MRSAGRLGLSLLVIGLLVLASHCSRKKSAVKVRPLKAAEAARLQEAYSPPMTKPKQEEAKEPLTPDRQEALGDLLLENRQYEGSLVNYLQVLRKHPERYDIRYKVGVIMLLSGQIEAAQVGAHGHRAAPLSNAVQQIVQ